LPCGLIVFARQAAFSAIIHLCKATLQHAARLRKSHFRPLNASVRPVATLMDIQYVNTDLEIESSQDVSRIVEEFGEDVSVLFHGTIKSYRAASFEIQGISREADDAINYFCSLIESFHEDVRGIWDKCVSRVFNIGYESGDSPNSYTSELRASTIQRLAKIGASVVITIYPTRMDVK
jgi:hypothetical protein